jgi:hypothetical protein
VKEMHEKINKLNDNTLTVIGLILDTIENINLNQPPSPSEKPSAGTVRIGGRLGFDVPPMEERIPKFWKK